MFQLPPLTAKELSAIEVALDNMIAITDGATRDRFQDALNKVKDAKPTPENLYIGTITASEK